ncbi:MAG: SMUG2 DNA glycosylase family protein [Bacteroidetes bacterium]|nr:SMUG2 DNA glycosylase family protein [Bacteroidota bacterium]
MKQNIGEKIIEFNKNLKFSGNLPDGFDVLNPFIENPETLVVMSQFYKKFYNDDKPRKFIIGINPSRHGAGVTGVPFTDTKRLETVCGIEMKSAHTHEVSSVFLYEVIEAFGGVEKFYKEFYINSPFPLAIVKKSKNIWVNANYYDDNELFASVKTYMIETLRKHLDLGLDHTEVFVLGKKNAEFLKKINKEEKLFGQLTVLEHPRYIQQYKSKEKEFYLTKYLEALTKK